MKGWEGGRGGDPEGHFSPSARISCVSVPSTVSSSVMYPNMAIATYKQLEFWYHSSTYPIIPHEINITIKYLKRVLLLAGTISNCRYYTFGG